MLFITQAVAGLFLAAAGTLATTTTPPTPTPACPGTECAFPDPADHECVAACVEAVLPDFGCNGIEDWNCHCTNFRRITAGSFACANACGAGMYAAFSGPAGQGCTCLQAECESSSEEPSVPPTTSEPPPPTTTPDTTTTPAPECPHPCAPSISAIPACATDCIQSAASEVGCGGDDFPCRCAEADAIQGLALGCVVGACGIGPALDAADAAAALCSCVTASPTTPCGGDASTTTPPPTTITPAPECPHPCAPSISAVPACATDCIQSAASEVGCGGDDFPCRCAEADAIQGLALGCVVGACGIGEALNAADAAAALCSCVTASPTTPCGSDVPITTTSPPPVVTTTTEGGEQPGETSTCEGDSDDEEEPTASSGEGTGSVPPVTGTTTAGEGGETPCPEESTGFVTKTVEVTTSVCTDDDGVPGPTATCSVGCGGDGGDGGDGGNGDDGGDGGDGDGDDGGDGGDGDDDEDDGSSPDPIPSGGPGGGDGGDDGGDDGGNGGGSPTETPGGGSTTTPTPPVVTAGASTVMMVGSGCLAGVVAAFVAFL